MLKPDLHEISKLLADEAEIHGGILPELYRAAWRAYLMALVGDAGDAFDHNDYIELRHHFPEKEDDPVSAMVRGRHYKSNYYGVADGEFVDETEFQGLQREIVQETQHFGGTLPTSYAVAWTGQLLGIYHCKLISDSEYDQLLAMLPAVDNNPVKKVEALMSKYVES